jgi:hypothetical protein
MAEPRPTGSGRTLQEPGESGPNWIEHSSCRYQRKLSKILQHREFGVATARADAMQTAKNLTNHGNPFQHRGCSKHVAVTQILDARLGYVEGADMREFVPVRCLSRDTVIKISERFSALNLYSFGGMTLKVEDVNYVDEDPFRDVHG